MRKPNSAQCAFRDGIAHLVAPETQATQFEQLLVRLGLTENTCHLNAECAAWCHANKNRRYIPDQVLHRLSTKTMYEDEVAPYSLVSGMVIPEPLPTQEEEYASKE